MILGPDWLFYVEIIAKSMLYFGIGFGIFSHYFFKWIESVWGNN
jgi:hypothetical protein